MHHHESPHSSLLPPFPSPPPPLQHPHLQEPFHTPNSPSFSSRPFFPPLQHPNVISYNEAFLDGHRLCIIMDFAPHGDLAGVIKNYSLARRHIPEDLLWVYLIQICNGLLALHSMRVLHRDVKPGNVMLFVSAQLSWEDR